MMIAPHVAIAAKTHTATYSYDAEAGEARDVLLMGWM
jgi:hypothetical protein